MALLYVIDISATEPWKHLESLQFEMSQFSEELITRPQLIVANKTDVEGCENNLQLLKDTVDIPVVAISAKFGTNLLELLQKIREIYDKSDK